MRNLILSLLLIPLAGCASSGMNGICGRITGTEMTIPYAGGKANVDGYVCHIGCVGVNCGKPDYAMLESVMNHYVDMQTTLGKLTTTGPGTITFTPSK